MENSYYNRWFQKDCINQFSSKNFNDFFKSEIELLKLIDIKINSVLDIGCASGRYYEVIKKYFPKFSFDGIDIVPEQIVVAKKNYPECSFKCANILSIKKIEKYDLINSTGVIQHEPNFNDLISLIINHSKKYALFDLKLIKSEKDISDINISFCGDHNNKLLYNLLSFKKLYNNFHDLNYVSDIFFYGYKTNLNSRTIVPNYIKDILHILDFHNQHHHYYLNSIHLIF